MTDRVWSWIFLFCQGFSVGFLLYINIWLWRRRREIRDAQAKLLRDAAEIAEMHNKLVACMELIADAHPQLRDQDRPRGTLH